MKVHATSCGTCTFAAGLRCQAPRGPAQPEPPSRSVMKSMRDGTAPPRLCPIREYPVTVELITHDLRQGDGNWLCRRCKSVGTRAWIEKRACSAQIVADGGFAAFAAGAQRETALVLSDDELEILHDFVIGNRYGATPSDGDTDAEAADRVSVDVLTAKIRAAIGHDVAAGRGRVVK